MADEQVGAGEIGWAIVEMMGHVRLAGRVSEEERFGVQLGRLDIPLDGGGYTTQYLGGQSVYRLTPMMEGIARAVAARNQPEPVGRWELPASVASPVARAAYSVEDDDDSGYALERDDDDDDDDDRLDDYLEAMPL